MLWQPEIFMKQGTNRGSRNEGHNMLTTERLLRTSDELPADLRRWLGRRGLVGLALEAVQTVDWRVNPVTDDNQEIRPQMMLTLLSYCYAAGICGSQDIEWAAQSDKTVRYICAGKEPDWPTIRRFRRRNAELGRRASPTLGGLASAHAATPVSLRTRPVMPSALIAVRAPR